MAPERSAVSDNAEPYEEPDLSLVFGSNSFDAEAVKIFVNRYSEREAFDTALANHRATVTDGRFDVQDLLTPRGNVLTYYGVGGVGKSELSRVLQRRLRGQRPVANGWPRLDSGPVKVVTTRLDLSSEGSLDLETMVLLLRIGVAPLHRAMPAFDIAFSRYWEANHPNESLGDYLRKQRRFAQLADAANVPGQITSATEELAAAVGQSSTLVTMGVKVIGLVGRLLRDTRTRYQAVRLCRRLRPLLEAPPDLESLSYYPHLLAWDLQQVRVSRPHQFVVFADTYEDVSARGERRFERLFQRAVWMMPNTMFVVTGRNRLDWADSDIAGALDHTGPVSWPGLVAGAMVEPVQHLVGVLSEHDSQEFLRRRLHRAGRPLIDDATCRSIARSTGGLPIHLDVAVARVRQLVDAGTTPTGDEFTGGFPEMVARLLRDLGREERRMLQVLCLFDSFDLDLARRASGASTESELLGLLGKSFMETDPTAAFPYSIHRLIRRTVIAAAGHRGTLTAADWRNAAQRVHETLGERAGRIRKSRHRAQLISCFNQGVRISHEYGVPLGWCVDAAYWSMEDSLWEIELAPRLDGALSAAGPGEPRTEAEAFARVMTAVVNRQSGDRTTTLAVLSDVIGRALLAGDALDVALYFRAESLRNVGRTAESEVTMRALIERGSRMADNATKGVLHWLRRRGRFRAEAVELEKLPAEGMWLRLRGDFAWAHGRLADGLAFYQRCEQWFDQQDQPGNAAEAAGCVAFLAGLAGLPDASLTIDAARLGLQFSRNTWGRLQAELGDLFRRAGSPDWTEDRLREVVDWATGNGLSSSVAYARFAACIDAAVRTDAELLRRRREELSAALPAGEFTFLVEIVDLWRRDDDPDEIPPGETDWAGDPAEVRGRWRTFIDSRRRHVPATV